MNKTYYCLLVDTVLLRYQIEFSYPGAIMKKSEIIVRFGMLVQYCINTKIELMRLSTNHMMQILLIMRPSLHLMTLILILD